MWCRLELDICCECPWVCLPTFLHPLTRACSMLAVMTFNVGYFLSVLGGIFLGELALGRYAPHAGNAHV